jgi:hypothetical protein
MENVRTIGLVHDTIHEFAARVSTDSVCLLEYLSSNASRIESMSGGRTRPARSDDCDPWLHGVSLLPTLKISGHRSADLIIGSRHRLPPSRRRYLLPDFDELAIATIFNRSATRRILRRVRASVPGAVAGIICQNEEGRPDDDSLAGGVQTLVERVYFQAWNTARSARTSTSDLGSGDGVAGS